MRLHLETLFIVDGRGRLVSVNDQSASSAPRLFLGWTLDGNAWTVRRDIPPALAEQLCDAAAAEPPDLDRRANPDRVTPYLQLLETHGSVDRIWTGPAYRFPAELTDSSATIQVTRGNIGILRSYLEQWCEDVRDGAPVLATLENGHAVSVCASVRESARAHEAGVETHPDFRGRGHAARAVSAWAKTVLEGGRLPLYSTSWENLESRRLADKLGLIQYGSVLHLA